MNLVYALFIIMVFFIPISLGYVFIRMWLRYIKSHSLLSTDHVLLELRLPREITKSPQAMEIFFSSLYQTGSTTYLEAYWSGKLRPKFSFELVSIEGKVKFFVWTRTAFKNYIETQIYAQYPNVEIYEATDYTDLVDFSTGKYEMWGAYFEKKEPDVYPIKSYIDYGLDKNPKEEYKIDPMTSVLEYLGSLKKDEYTWIQIIIQARKSEGLKEGRIFQAKRENWKKEVEEEIKKIRKEATDPNSGRVNLDHAQVEKVEAMSRSMTKLPFECCIRGIYIGPADAFNSGMAISGLIGSFRQYSSNNLNRVGHTHFTDHDDFGSDMLEIFSFISPFRNWMAERLQRMKETMLQAYIERAAFGAYAGEPGRTVFWPFTSHRSHYDAFVMTTEELATVFHFPSQIATSTPTLDRISAKKSEAPANLPI